MIILFAFLTIAVVQDFKTLKVSNRLILIGMIAAVFYRFFSNGLEEVLKMIDNMQRRG